MQGNIVFKGYDYTYTYDREVDGLKLITHDATAGVAVEFICRQTADTEKRWREFQRIFAKSVAGKKLMIHIRGDHDGITDQR